MIIGIGTDLVDIARVAGVWQRQGERFTRRLLSVSEQQAFANHTQPERFLAKRWAAKEAISKALGTGIAQGVCFEDMTISHTEQGQPLVVLSGTTYAYAQSLGVTSWHLSLSDEKTHAIAFAIAQN